MKNDWGMVLCPMLHPWVSELVSDGPRYRAAIAAKNGLISAKYIFLDSCPIIFQSKGRCQKHPVGGGGAQ